MNFKDGFTIITFRATPFYCWNSNSTLSHFVELAFNVQLRMFCFDAFQLYCHFFAGRNICAQIDISERARSYFSSKAIAITNSELHRLRNSFEKERTKCNEKTAIGGG